jgi:hypothetical protein
MIVVDDIAVADDSLLHQAIRLKLKGNKWACQVL